MTWVASGWLDTSGAGRYYNSTYGTTRAASGSAYNGAATIKMLQIGEYQDGTRVGYQTFWPAPSHFVTSGSTSRS